MEKILYNNKKGIFLEDSEYNDIKECVNGIRALNKEYASFIKENMSLFKDFVKEHEPQKAIVSTNGAYL